MPLAVQAGLVCPSEDVDKVVALAQKLIDSQCEETKYFRVLAETLKSMAQEASCNQKLAQSLRKTVTEARSAALLKDTGVDCPTLLKELVKEAPSLLLK